MYISSSLSQLREELRAWKGIAIAKTSNPVPGEGNPRAKIVFIGEAPGKKEDEQGKPFVGQAGNVFNALLTSIDLKREDVYVTNIVKFRPPDNRDPTAKEVTACLPFLQQELSIIQPKVIVPLGRHALTHFLPDTTITETHGRPHTLADGTIIFPLYHPAAALHNPNLRQTLFEDMKMLGEFLKSG